MSTAAPNANAAASRCTDERKRSATVDAGTVYHGLALSAGDQPPPVHWDCDRAGDWRENARLPQNNSSLRPAFIAPGAAATIALSTTSIVAIDKVSEANAIGTTVANAMPARSNGALVKAVAEHERERDGERRRRDIWKPGRGADHHANHLADRTASEAVKGRAQRHLSERDAHLP